MRKLDEVERYVRQNPWMEVEESTMSKMDKTLWNLIRRVIQFSVESTVEARIKIVVIQTMQNDLKHL